MLFFKHIVRNARGWFRRLARDNGGFALLETIMAITIFAALGTAVMVGIRTANISGVIVDEQSIAEKLARNQLEYVFTQDYVSPPGSYVTIDAAQDVAFTVDAGYTVTAVAEALTAAEFDLSIVNDTNMQKVTVTINHRSKTILTLETLRTK